MFHVKLSIHPNNVGCNRQIPGRSYVWKDFIFHINEDINECDFWVVYSKGLSRKESCFCSSENTLFITGEPETTYHYSHGFLRQFARVLSVQEKIRHPNMKLGQPGLPWYIGKITQKEKDGDVISFSCDYDSLKNGHPTKTKILSLITSNKRFTKGHNERIAFSTALKEYYGDKLDIYGHGFQEFEDKAEVLMPYKYHICLENSSYLNYWSEKLADCFLAECYPIYYGAPNASDYFDPMSLTEINIRDIESSIKKINEAIAYDYFGTRYSSILQSKELVLDEYNLFETIRRELIMMDGNAKKEMLTLKPDTSYMDWQKIQVMIIDRIKNRWIR